MTNRNSETLKLRLQCIRSEDSDKFYRSRAKQPFSGLSS
jgi:hypothetical protein